MAIIVHKENHRYNIKYGSCLSSDVKPTTWGYGSTIYESDTGHLFLYTDAGWVRKYESTLGFDDLPIVVTPTIAGAAFSANDFVGGKLTIAGAMRVAAGAGVLESLTLIDASKQNAALSIYIFKAALAGTYADNATESISAADWLLCLGTIDILPSDYRSMANASVVALGGFGMKVKATAGTSLFALIVTTGTPTYGANALQLTFGFGRN